MQKSDRLQAWIYLLDSKGMIVDQVKVSWPSVRKVFLEAKKKLVEGQI